MRCPKCDWTTVSFELETRRWSCRRCHETFTDGESRPRPVTSKQAASPARTPRAGGPSAKAARGTQAKSGAGRASVKKKSAAPAKKKTPAGAKKAKKPVGRTRR